MGHNGVEIKIAGSSYYPISFSYKLFREIDFNGMPTSNVHGGKIKFSIETSNDNRFMEWVVDPFLNQDGRIQIRSSYGGDVIKTIEFQNAYVVGYKESFHSHNPIPMLIEIILSPRRIKINDAIHDNDFPD